jgi:hypothetical protein
MAKRLIPLLAILAAIASAVPTTASASKLTSSAGVLAKVGSTITATGKEIDFTSSLQGTIVCEELEFKWTLTKNDGTTVEGSYVAEVPVSSGCGDARNIKITTIHITKLVAGPTGDSMSFTIDTYVEGASPFECTITGTNVPFTYVAGGNTIAFTKASGINGVGCGSYLLDADFKLEISSTPVILD